MGTTAKEGIIGVQIRAAGRDRHEAQQLAERICGEIRGRLGRLVFGQDDETLAGVIARTLTERGLTVSTAESCTAGLLAARLTDIPGSSRYFLWGVVTYSNESKMRLLGVPGRMLAEHGAVSRPVAEVMAANCRSRAGSDYAVSITGIAGPSGGTSQKPVGLVFTGVAGPHGVDVREHRFGTHRTRQQIRERACNAALDHLRLMLGS